MSLVYAKKSDAIGCVLCVFLHATMACGTEILMCEGHQEWCGYTLYESLLTYVAHMDLEEIRFKVPATRARPRYSLLKFVRYLPRIL
jgi:hypothetical protein